MVRQNLIKELHPMAIFVAVLIAFVLFGLVALVADTMRTAARVGGYPPVEFTHRAYGA
jgi:hypothetical protein